MWCNNSNAALIYEGESILDIFDFDSQFWQDFGKEGVLRYYFLVLLLALFFWFLNGVGFLEEKISNIFGKKNALDFFRKDIPSDNLLRKKRKKKRKKK
jgi:hypothetical protein